MRKEFIPKVLLVLFAMLLHSTAWGESTPATRTLNGATFLGGGSGTQTDPLLITTAEHLEEFSTLVNEGVITNEYVKLAADIDCTSLSDFMPIGCLDYPFIGTFTGGTADNHYTISNLTIKDDLSYVGLFGIVGNDGSIAVIENLDLSNCKITAGYYTGAVAGLLRYNSKITNCIVSSSEISCSQSAGAANTGGIVGKVSYSEVSHCQVSSSTITAVSNATDDNATTITAGGIAGLNEVGNINYCEVKGSTKVTSNFSKSTMYVYGGAVIGWNNSDNTTTTQANVYESSVTTTVRGVEYKDQAPRGIGQEDGSCYDIFNQVMMAGTKKVTISATDLNGITKVELGTIAANTYYFTETEGEGTNSKLKAIYTLPNNNMVLQVTSAPGYKPTLTLSDEAVEVTPTETFENRIWTIQYAFKMPGDDVTATVAFTKDLAGLKEENTYIYNLETDKADYTYTGDAIEPIISWTNADPDPVVLTKGTDYEIKGFFEIKGGAATPMYQEDGKTPKAPVNVGSYKISITGKGNYSGTRELEFKIIKANLWDSNKWTSPAGKTGLKYTGEDQELVTAATVPQGVTIKYYTKYSSDGFIDYNYLTSSGEVWSEVVPTGKETGYYAVFYKMEGGDNYEDGGPSAIGIAVNIDKGVTTITAGNQTVTYTGDPQEYTGASVADNENATLNIAYYTSEENCTNEEHALTGVPTDAKTYYVKATLSDPNYTADPKTAVFTISPKSIETSSIELSGTLFRVEDNSFEYNGQNQKPEIIVTDLDRGANGTLLVENTDYTVTNDGGVNVGEYTVTVTGMGNYSGTVNDITFIIRAKEIETEDITVTLEDQGLTFDGTEKKPAVASVTIPGNGAPIVLTTDDYDADGIVYGNNIDAGVNTATATVELKGNYSGTGVATFTIDRATLNLTINLDGWTYLDTPNEPSLDGNLEEGDITWEYKAAGAEAYSAWSALTKTTDAGTYMVRATVAETVNYEGGSKEAEFVIDQYDLENATVTLDYDELIYNGKDQTVNVMKVMAGDIEVDPSYYEVSGNTGTQAGNYTLTVTAKTKDSSGNEIKNNFKNTVTATFTIKNHRTVTKDELGLSEDQPQATYYSNTEDLDVPDGVVAYIITGVSEGKVTTRRISYIPKGMPVFVELTTSSEESLTEIPDPSQLPLKGTAEPKDVSSITGGTVYVLYNGEFVKSVSGTIPAHRCYLLLSNDMAGGARAFGIIRGDGGSDGLTAIKPIDNAPSTIDNWYDMQGRRIDKPTKTGIYIKDGKLVVINKK